MQAAIKLRHRPLRKHRKVDYENQRKKEILRRQKQEEDYWDEYEDYNSQSSSDESDCNEPTAHDLGELLPLKTRQMDKYGYELSHKSNY